jgi:transcriptional regulator with XRE-family HTH domain
MESPYPFLGKEQPKTLSEITNLNFGTHAGMKQPIDPIAFGRRVKEKREGLGLSQQRLGKLSDYSQSNIQWAESGKQKDPRIQAQDFAEPLRTTVEWLLYGTGVRDVTPPPMTAEDMFEIWNKLSLEAREAMSAQATSDLAARKKSKSR